MHAYDAQERALFLGVDPMAMRRRATLGTLAALGAIEQTFNAEQVWADVQKGGSCYTPGTPFYIAIAEYQAQDPPNTQAANVLLGQCNAAGAKATHAIREALVKLGYGDGITYGVGWSEANPGQQWKAFLADYGMAPGPGLGVTKLGLQQMEAKLKGQPDVVTQNKKKKWWILAAAGAATAVVGGGAYYLSQR